MGGRQAKFFGAGVGPFAGSTAETVVEDDVPLITSEEVSAAGAALAEANQLLTAAQGPVTGLTAQLVANQADIDRLTGIVDNNQQSLDSLNAELAALDPDDDSPETVAEIDRLTRNITATTGGVNGATAARDAEVAEREGLETQLAAAETEVEQLTSAVATAQAEFDALRDAFEAQ